MKLSKLKRLLNDIAVFGNYFVHRKCLLGDIIRYDSSAACGACEYSCFSRHCITEGVSVLK